MTWAEYYERYDGWQESTQYSRLASITNFGPDESPSEEISDCIQYVDTRTATSILRRALAAGVRFQTSEVVEIADSGQVEDEDALIKADSNNSRCLFRGAAGYIVKLFSSSGAGV